MNAAHLHLMINHIPVLGALAVLALLILSAFKNNRDIYQLTLVAAILVGVLTIPVFLSGEPAEDIVEKLPLVGKSLIEEHEDFSKFGLISTEIVAALALVATVLYFKSNRFSKRLLILAIFVALINSGFMVYTAYLGGRIVHAEIR